MARGGARRLREWNKLTQSVSPDKAVATCEFTAIATKIGEDAQFEIFKAFPDHFNILFRTMRLRYAQKAEENGREL